MSGNPSGHGATRLAIRVRPGSSRPGVGGSHDGALIVRVSARAVDGRTTAAAIAAVADAAGVRAACSANSAARVVAGSGRSVALMAASQCSLHLSRLAEEMILWASQPFGFIKLPERCANLCFGGPKNNRLYMASSHSLYAFYVEAHGAV